MIKKPTTILHQHNHMCFGANFHILETTHALIHASRHVLFDTNGETDVFSSFDPWFQIFNKDVTEQNNCSAL